MNVDNEGNRIMKARRGTREIAALLVAATTLSLTAAPAQAGTNNAQDSIPAQSIVKPDIRAAALAQAKATGSPVTISSLTTADSMTVADPDGSFTTTTSAFPTRMTSASGAWENIDPTLRRLPDGTLTTTATPDVLTLSGGGSGDVATISDAAGHSLGLGLDVTLPSPALNGPTATYANVYPGINLVVTAQPTGSFDEVFVVGSAAAAQTMSEVTFTTHLKNLALTSEPDGQVTATDPATGGVFATSPAAMMWDSNEPNTQLSASTIQDPAPDAHLGPMPASLTPGALSYAVSLGGPAAQGSATGRSEAAAAHAPAISGSDPVKYPLYLDPTWTLPTPTSGEAAWAEVHSGGVNTSGGNCDTDVTYNQSGYEPGAGYNNSGYCVGQIQSYFNLNTSSIPATATSITSTLKASELYSAYNSCGQANENITANWTGGITSSTDWLNRPANAAGNVPNTQSVKADGQGSSACSGGVAADWTMSADVAANKGNSQITIDLVGPTTANSLERFNANPYLTTSYDILPNTPTTITASPIPQTGPTSPTQGCGSQAHGFISHPTSGYAVLSAVVTSQVNTAQLRGDFTVVDTTANPQVTTTIDSSGYAASGATVSVNTPALTDGHSYTWSVIADDGYNVSAASASCTFTADFTPPTTPTVTSTAFPASGSGASTTTYAGHSGTLTLSSTDTAAGGGTASGLAGYEYSLDSPVPTSGGTLVTNPVVTVTPSTWGTHVLYAEAFDNAGNVSAQSQYSFFVPFQPGSPTTGVPGNIDGKGVPDLVATTGGNLVEYPGDTDPADPPTPLSTPTYSPDGTSWSNFLIGHHGSFTNGTVDDLWAYDKNKDASGNNDLFLYSNTTDGLINTTKSTTNYRSITKSEITGIDDGSCTPTDTGSCTGWDSTNWNNLTQLLPVDNTQNNYEALITVENGQLWYYQGQSSPYYLNDVYNIGSTGWGNVSLVGSNASGSHITIWARDTSTGSTAGDLYSYTLTFDATGQPVSLGTATSGTVIGTGFTAAAYPALASPGPTGTDTNPDLYAIDSAGKLYLYPGATGGSLTPAHQYELTTATTGAFGSNPDGSTPMYDTAPTNQMNGYISATGSTFNTIGNPNPTLTFDGNAGCAAATTGTAINTTGSYTVSAWVNLSTLPSGNATAVSEFADTDQNSPFYLQYNSGNWAFAISNNNTSTPTIDGPDNGTPVVANTWYQIVGVYTASAHTAQIYVNGHLAGTQTGLTTWATTGDLNIGRDLYTGYQVDYFPGLISDVETFNTALTSAEVAALYAGPAIPTTAPVLIGTIGYTNAA